LYKELVETNTTLSAGSCTLAAERMAARLKAAGYKEGDIRLSPGASAPTLYSDVFALCCVSRSARNFPTDSLARY
jgi:hypothetical protein